MIPGIVVAVTDAADGGHDPGLRERQQKTTMRLLIPVHADLVSVLDAAPREHVTILNNAHGKPFTVSGFGNFMRDAIAGEGLPLECQPHGLRKAAGRRLAEAGCSANEIMAILGQKSLAEAERYTRQADRGRIARAAMVRLSDRKANIHSRTTPEEFGKSGEK